MAKISGEDSIKEPPSSLPSLIAGACGAGASKTITAPLSRLTILLQLESMKAGNDNIPYESRRFFSSVKDVHQREGLRSFWRGNVIAVLHKLPYGGLNYYTYELSKSLMMCFWNSPDDPGIAVRFSAGFAAGATATTLTYPLDFLRTQLTACQDKKPPGIVSKIREIVSDGGMGAFRRGLGCTVWCQSLNLALNFAIYESLQVKVIQFERNLYKKLCWTYDAHKQRSSFFSSLLCGAIAGSCASCVVYPLDLIRRCQQMNTKNLSICRIFVCTTKRSGFAGLYRGLVPELLKVSPAVAINFYVYELVRQELLGVTILPR